LYRAGRSAVTGRLIAVERECVANDEIRPRDATPKDREGNFLARPSRPIGTSLTEHPCDHPGVDDPRADRIDADSTSSAFECRTLG